MADSITTLLDLMPASDSEAADIHANAATHESAATHANNLTRSHAHRSHAHLSLQPAQQEP